jgi:hypothetical protein
MYREDPLPASGEPPRGDDEEDTPCDFIPEVPAVDEATLPPEEDDKTIVDDTPRLE